MKANAQLIALSEKLMFDENCSMDDYSAFVRTLEEQGEDLTDYINNDNSRVESNKTNA